jgi:hypothetical protein
MNIKMKKISVLILLSLTAVSMNAQVRQPHSLYFMNTIPQVSQMNPALQPRANVYVALPVNVNADLRLDLALKDVFQKQGNQWYTPVEQKYDYDKLYRSIGKKSTMFNAGLDLDIIGFGFRTGSGYFSFGLSEHVSVTTSLPSDLFKITEKGFPDGTSLDFSPLRTQALAYMQMRIGYSTRVTDRLTVGVNVKPLFGQAAVATKIDKFKLQTGKKQWDLDAKGNIYSSLPIEEVVLDEDDKIDEIKFRDSDDYKTNDYSFNNPGIAFDLGAVYQFDERLSASASLNNLGFISWKNDLNSVAFNGKYTFNGVKFDASSDDDFGDLFSNLGDSILDAMQYKVRHDRFKTALPPVLHLGAQYRLTNAISAGFLSRSVFWQKGMRQSFNLSLNLQPYSFVAFNLGATWQVKSAVYLGAGFTIFAGPLQIYLLSDYVPVYYSTVRIDDGDKFPFPERQKTFTVRTGLNLVFGKHGYRNKPMLNQAL